MVKNNLVSDNLENPASDEVYPQGFFNIISESVCFCFYVCWVVLNRIKLKQIEVS